MEKTIVDEALMARILDRITHEILEKHTATNKLCLVGIKTRGVHIAKRLHDRIKKFSGLNLPLGELDITLYRDDLTQVADQPQMKATTIGFDINGMDVILVDDVLYTGRTVRCALDALIDFGRPRRIELLVMVDRGHRELPIHADICGKNVPTKKSEVIEVRVEELDGKDEVVICERDA